MPLLKLGLTKPAKDSHRGPGLGDELGWTATAAHSL